MSYYMNVKTDPCDLSIEELGQARSGFHTTKFCQTHERVMDLAGGACSQVSQGGESKVSSSGDMG